MITDRDRDIINFIQDIGFLTIEQAGKLFFTDSKVSYDLARNRLKKLIKQDLYIKAIRNTETKQLLYVPKESKLKRVSKHDLLVLDYLAELKCLGCEVEAVEVEKDFGGIIPDAYVRFIFNGYRYHQLLEIELRHDYVDINRFNKVKDKILQETNNILPTIVIVQDTNKDYSIDNKTDMEVVQLRTNLNDIAKVLLQVLLQIVTKVINKVDKFDRGKPSKIAVLQACQWEGKKRQPPPGANSDSRARTGPTGQARLVQQDMLQVIPIGPYISQKLKFLDMQKTDISI